MKSKFRVLIKAHQTKKGGCFLTRINTNRNVRIMQYNKRQEQKSKLGGGSPPQDEVLEARVLRSGSESGCGLIAC